MMKYSLHTLSWWLLVVGVTLAAAPDPLSQALREQQAADAHSIASQKRIEQLDDESRRMLEEYRQLVRELEVLKPRNEQRERLISAQDDELKRIREQLVSLEATQREIEPMMQRTLSVLERFIALDAPFLPQERRTRLEGLRQLLEQPGASQPEKFRRLLEAYQVESDYGRTIEAYRGELEQDGRRRLVEFLRLGRLALYYLSLDGEESAIWNRHKGEWTRLEPRHNREIAQAIRIAKKQAPPNLMPLPLFAPGGD